MGIETGLAVVALGAAIGGTVKSIQEQKQAGKEAKKARRAQSRINDLREQRTRRQTIREAIIKRGQLENISAQTGGVGSSAASQAESSISSQLGSNLSFLSQTGSLTDEISRRQQLRADAIGRAQTSQTISGLGFKAASAIGLPTFGKDPSVIVEGAGGNLPQRSVPGKNTGAGGFNF